MEDKIQILVVDDHQVVREGIGRLLGDEEGIELVGQGSNSQEALLQVEMYSPDIVLMDIKMPDVDGIELTRQLKQKYPDCNVIMLTLYDEYLNQAIEAGARGYLLKDIKREDLAEAIRRVHSGHMAISDSIQAKNQLSYEDRRNLQNVEGSRAVVEEVQVVLSPPVEANQLMRFAGRTEERLQSRVLQMVGAWEEGTVMTIALNRATPLSTVVSQFRDIPEIETVDETPKENEVNPKLLKKAMSIPKADHKARATLFVKLERN
jgi:DNA-binding NarL/FixJ family response regulator